jgi:tetratricopeptide (TPR) repeat protein
VDRSLRLRVFASWLLGGAALVPLPLMAAPGADVGPAAVEAGERYQQGIKLYEDGDYAASLAEFRRAYSLAPAYQVLFNLARVHRQMQNYIEAQRHFERYLREGGRRVPRARAEEVRRELDELRKRVARLDIRCGEPDVEIFLDDESVGKTPLTEPVLVNAGRRRLTAVKPLYETFRTTLEVVGAETRVVVIALVEQAPAAPVAGPPAVVAPVAPAARAAPPTVAAPTRPWGTPIWLGFGAAGLLAAGAITTGVVSYVQAADAREQADRAPVGPSYDEQRRGAERWALATDLLAGASLATAGVTLVFALTSRPSTQTAWGVGPGGFVVAGRF